MPMLTGPDVVRERVHEQLGRMPGAVVTDDPHGGLVLVRGDRVTAIQVVGLQPDVTLVVVYAVIATDVPELDEACRFLATRSMGLPLVHFELLGSTLVAAHGLLGEFLASPELQAAVEAVTDAAETLGPQVCARFGGRLLGASPLPVTQPRPSVDVPVVAAPVSPRSPDRSRLRRVLRGVGATLVWLLVGLILLGALVSWWRGWP